MSTSTSADAAAGGDGEEDGKREFDPGDIVKALMTVLDCLRREEGGSVSF